jgi:hypothetical protein
MPEQRNGNPSHPEGCQLGGIAGRINSPELGFGESRFGAELCEHSPRIGSDTAICLGNNPRRTTNEIEHNYQSNKRNNVNNFSVVCGLHS